MNTLSLYLKSGLVVLLCTSTTLAKKQVFTLDEDKVIHASASSLDRTRISFQGDGLKEAMGFTEDTACAVTKIASRYTIRFLTFIFINV